MSLLNLQKLRNTLSKTREKFGVRLSGTLDGEGQTISEEDYQDIENHLLSSDIGYSTTEVILTALRNNSHRKAPRQRLYQSLEQEITKILKKGEARQSITSNPPVIILMVGVNGVGKTTTVAKLAHHLQEQGQQPLLVAADTFRAAAIQQLRVWGDRLGIEVISQSHGADPAAVTHDAIQRAIVNNQQVIVIDTAGRQHTQANLMDQLAKIQRVSKRLMPDARLEILISLDATTGQNTLAQIRQFNKSVSLTGICLNKLDGSAKGGVILSCIEEFGLPIRFLGVGEGIEDLIAFNAMEFATALMPQPSVAE